MKTNETIQCACGCGQVLERYDTRGRERKFIHGHWSKLQPNQRVEVACEQCGRMMQRPQWHLRKGLRHAFCSRVCAGAWAAVHGTKRGDKNGHYNTITVECAGCGAPVSKAQSLINRRSRRVYCGQCIEDAKSTTRAPYPPEFDRSLRMSIRKRDLYTCQQCGERQGEGWTLHIHHINYTTTDSDPMNLISLCPSCHGRTNWSNRVWTERFQALMRERFPDGC